MRIFRLFCFIALSVVAIFSILRLIKYDDGNIETIKMLIARECVFDNRSDIAEQMLKEVSDETRRQDILASIAGTYLTTDIKKSNILFESIKLQSAKDRYYLYRIEKRISSNMFATSFIKNHSIRAYAKYIVLEKYLDTDEKFVSETVEAICNELANERNISIRNEYALRLMDKAIEYDRFNDFLYFLLYSIYSIERNALIYKAFRCSNSDKGGDFLIKKTNNHISSWIIAAKKNNEYFLREKGYDAYLQRLKSQTYYFRCFRDISNQDMLFYLIGTLYSDSVGRKDESISFRKLATSFETINSMSYNLDTYAEISAVLLSNAGFSKNALDILDCVHIKKVKINILRKYLYLYSDKGKNIDRIIKIIKNP